MNWYGLKDFFQIISWIILFIILFRLFTIKTKIKKKEKPLPKVYEPDEDLYL